jgi:hypothetical protein
MLIRPRITDHYGIHLSQEQIDFAVPFFGEDMPLCIDPFLLWKSPSQQYNALHTSLLSAINTMGEAFQKTSDEKLVLLLQELSECDEVGLGFSPTRKGVRISELQARSILTLFKEIPTVTKHGFTHFEIIQSLVEGIAKDRISDITASILKSFLIDYTVEQANKYRIPLEKDIEVGVFDSKTISVTPEKVSLPINPETRAPLVFVPKHWLRRGPWINGDDYFEGFFPAKLLDANISKPSRGEILLYNRENYGLILEYLAIKERTADACRNDPIFTPLPLLSVKRKLKELKALPSGKTDNADKRYEEIVGQLLATLLFPHLDFASTQSRNDAGTQIRDVIFYNNRTIDFLDEILSSFNSRQLIFELKNVANIERDHVNQLNRYLADPLDFLA